MTAERRLERDLPQILGDLAIAPYPDYVDDVLSTTAQRRQRPGWTFPERWLPMDLATERVPTPSLPWRQLGTVALIAILIGAALAIYVGSQPRLPDPFGPAANGVIPFERDGSVYLFDPETGTETTVATGVPGWIDPWFSPDGRTLLLAHELTAVDAEFGVLSVDGGDIRVVTPDPLNDASWLEWNPASDALITVSTVVHERGGINFLEPGVSIIDVAAGTVTTVETDPGPTYATFIPPTGEHILVVTQDPARASRVTRMRPDGSDPEILLETATGHQMIGRPNLSPDGALMAYGAWDPAEERVALHLFDMETRDDRRLADDPSIEFTAHPRFSPDGRTLVVERREGRQGPTEDVHAAFIDVETGTVTASDLVITDGAAIEWSPDGMSIVASLEDEDGVMQPHVLVDPTTGLIQTPPWHATGYPSWQRLAP